MKPHWNNAQRGPRPLSVGGFTLLELLVAIGIIAILASLGLPAVRNLGNSNLTAAVNRQIIDDIGLARMRAINERTTVYMVFVTPVTLLQAYAGETDPARLRQLTNLVAGQYSAYALFAKRKVGDQPGQMNPDYLTSWKTLPEGVFFATNKFDPNPAALTATDLLKKSLPVDQFPFPNEKGKLTALPYLAFNAQGQLTTQRDEALAYVKGSIFFPQDPSGNYLFEPPDVVQTPPGLTNATLIRVNWLTGRAATDAARFP